MLKSIRQISFGIIIGLILGLWFGVNMGKNKPLFSNPFAEEDLQLKAKQKTEEIIQDTKEVIREQLKD